MSFSDSDGHQDWRFTRFGLIVTGHTEAKCIPALFRVMEATGACTFQVIRRIKQRSPRSKRSQLRMVGSGKKIPDRDETDIGLPARCFLSSDDMFVVLIDDLEANRSDRRKEIFDRYRRALDTMLLPSQAGRSSVHFLVNMLESYFFANCDAVNAVLGTNLEDYDGDVETMRNPKARIKSVHSGYKVIDDGCKIIGRLDVPHVLSRRDACSSLRTMFAWIHKAMGEPESEVAQFLAGRLSEVTEAQICALPA
ncbi:MAG: DUF4276 family protein [Spirochaetaceae bacterium]|nr:DUF4276 family protein [Spirochaetaceae bacterium]